MRQFLLIFFTISVLSCSNNPTNYLEHINGYWEIDKVIFSDGSIKEYKYNETIDYISLNDSLKGFRKKLKPNFNSKYITSEDAEGLRAKIENDTLYLNYKTPYAQWRETVLEANKNSLKILNDRETIYVYKRYKPIELDLE